ncbi:MAG: methyltransferase domain-containing protein [Gammaproteobacteria bacterium]|nr:methyltransferase domain-containing protein [Gammaproteobacteria bacterium]
MSETTDVFGFLDLLAGYQPAMVVMAARRLGVFDNLTAEPRDVADLGAAIGADPAALGALLRSLAGIGLVVEDGNRFAATPFVTAHLAGGRDLALVIEKEEYFARAWLSLDDVVRTGRPVLEPWRNRLASDPATAHMFLEALNVLAEHTGPRPWELPELAPGRRVLDVGGGFGYYALRLAEAGSTVVLVDLPPVTEALERRLDMFPNASIELIGVDVMTAPSCGVDADSVDAALVSHMVHDLSEAEGVDLLRRVCSAVRSGGTVVVNDFAGDAGPGAFGPLFDVMMRIETGGAAYPLATLRSMLELAGLQGVRVVDLPEPVTLLMGRVA